MRRYKDFFASGMTQWGLFLSMGAINLFVPRMLGANLYGLSSFLIAVPFFFQGIFEAVHYAVSVKWAGKTDEQRVIKITAFFSFIWLIVGCIVTSGLIYFNPSMRHYNHPGKILILANLLICLLFAVTWLSGRGFAASAYKIIAVSTIIFSMVLVTFLFFFQVRSVEGYLFTYCLAQIVVVVYLYVGLRYNHEVSLLRIVRGEFKFLPFTEISASMISRFSLIVLNTVAIIIAGYCLPQKLVGELKLSISIISAGMFIIPISPVIVQKEAEELNSIHVARQAKRIVKILLSSIVISLILVAGIMTMGRLILMWLLSNRGFSGLNFPIIMSLPFFCLIPLVNSVNIGMKTYGSLYIATSIMLITLCIGIYYLGVGWGFFIATGFYSIPLLIVTLLRLRACISFI